MIDPTVGWEEGGLARVYLHPGKEAVTEMWPATTIGATRSAEDATFVDLNRDNMKATGISGPEGVKFDRIELVDLDRDGDLDILICEEHHVVGEKRMGLGVIWYENPF